MKMIQFIWMIDSQNLAQVQMSEYELTLKKGFAVRLLTQA